MNLAALMCTTTIVVVVEEAGSSIVVVVVIEFLYPFVTVIKRTFTHWLSVTTI